MSIETLLKSDLQCPCYSTVCVITQWRSVTRLTLVGVYSLLMKKAGKAGMVAGLQVRSSRAASGAASPRRSTGPAGLTRGGPWGGMVRRDGGSHVGLRGENVHCTTRTLPALPWTAEHKAASITLRGSARGSSG